MEMIREIRSISLSGQNLQISNFYKAKDQSTLKIAMGIKKIEHNNDRDLYRASVCFEISMDEGELELFSVEHTISFTSDKDDIEGNSEDLAKSLCEIIEPYIRKQLLSVFDETEIPTPILPYRFWKKIYK